MSYKATIVICHVPKHAGFFMDDLLAQVGFQFFRLLQECQIQPFFFSKYQATGVCIIWFGLCGWCSCHHLRLLLCSSAFYLGLIKDREFPLFGQFSKFHEICLHHLQGRPGDPGTSSQISLAKALTKCL